MHLPRFRLIEPSDKDWIVQQHQLHYAQSDGFDSSFSVLVGAIMDDFLAHHDPECERGWMLVRGARRLGCILCVRLDSETAKLRLFFLQSDARGLGLGRDMLTECMKFAQEHGYLGMKLWTHESHQAACALYKAAGWTLESSKPVLSFGQNLVEQQWRYRF